MDVCHQHKLQAEPVGCGGTAGAGGAGAVPAGGSGHAQILGVRHQAGAVPWWDREETPGRVSGQSSLEDGCCK